MSTPVFQPAMWYDVTARDDNEACVNFDKEFTVNPCWSNGGTVIVECGLCNQTMEITSATLLDPQPEIS
ncbi:hypothetical protein ACWD48_19465 [Streptomyces sp. NPDC002519]